ncbi:VOC family protein [Kineococcus sp. T13]|uniref:VOC family protein n=1 Tax=Kineococcus vitellinus TaxID=2696565 RepID=UPI0014131B7B|nr:VOC family protein [Kineococcus vitellinus]NAZ77094.1 VOC family protein [Kineococcus vitellinus]
MTFTHVLAGALVSDLSAAETWYTTLFERAPDARPMEGLLQWHLPGGSGVQVYRDPDRAGRGSLVLHADDLDAAAARLSEASVRHEGPEPGGGARILRLSDPDGNAVVLTGT